MLDENVTIPPNLKYICRIANFCRVSLWLFMHVHLFFCKCIWMKMKIRCAIWNQIKTWFVFATLTFTFYSCCWNLSRIQRSWILLKTHGVPVRRSIYPPKLCLWMDSPPNPPPCWFCNSIHFTFDRQKNTDRQKLANVFFSHLLSRDLSTRYCEYIRIVGDTLLASGFLPCCIW